MTNKTRGHKRLFKGSAVVLTATALGLGLALTGIQSASAHDGGVSADCNSGLTINLSNYPGNSTIEGTVDGKPYPKVAFSGSYADRITWVPTVNHSYSLTVVSGDGDHNFDKKFSDSITNCVPVSTPTPTPPVVTPTPTPSHTPPVSTPTPTPSATSYVPVIPEENTPASSAPVVVPDNPVVKASNTPKTGELAYTGSEGVMGVGVIAVILIGAGIWIVLDKRRRARKSSE